MSFISTALTLLSTFDLSWFFVFNPIITMKHYSISLTNALMGGEGQTPMKHQQNVKSSKGK